MGTERVLDLVAMARTGKGGGGGESGDTSGGRGGGRGGVGADDGKGGGYDDAGCDAAMLLRAAAGRNRCDGSRGGGGCCTEGGGGGDGGGGDDDDDDDDCVGTLLDEQCVPIGSVSRGVHLHLYSSLGSVVALGTAHYVHDAFLCLHANHDKWRYRDLDVGRFLQLLRLQAAQSAAAGR